MYNKTYETVLKDFDLEDIRDSGQSFRLVHLDKESLDKGKDIYELIALGKLLRITVLDREAGRYEFSCDKQEFYNIWYDYFDLGADYSAYRKVVSKEDKFLNEAVSYGKGIRILRQDPWEVMIEFIISQRKSVPAIRTTVDKLCHTFGKCFENEDRSRVLYAFPGANMLSIASLDSLRECGVGYRAEYILDAAKRVARGTLSMELLDSFDTESLIKELMNIKGIGVKVATCIALFGFHRLECFPLDVWMKRVLTEVYKGTLPMSYLPYAGVLQQYMFNYARKTKKFI